MISVQHQDFCLATEYASLRDNDCQDGAIVTFVGLVRDFNQGAEVTGLYLEHYPGMTEKSLEAIADQARSRWPITQLRIIHRVGQLQLGDQIVFIGVSSPHRQAAFLAAQFVMDYLKVQAPFWKKETTTVGERWVDANLQDKVDSQKW